MTDSLIGWFLKDKRRGLYLSVYESISVPITPLNRTQAQTYVYYCYVMVRSVQRGYLGGMTAADGQSRPDRRRQQITPAPLHGAAGGHSKSCRTAQDYENRPNKPLLRSHILACVGAREIASQLRPRGVPRQGLPRLPPSEFTPVSASPATATPA